MDGDRMLHRIWLNSTSSEPKPMMIALTLEGNNTQDWPPSPPFQQIVCEANTIGKKPPLLCVGMAGKSHWSGSIEADEMTGAIAFDMACRTSDTPSFLGSTYSVAPTWNLVSIDSNRLNLDHPSGLSLSLRTVGDTTIAIADTDVSQNDKAEFKSIIIAAKIDPANHRRGKTYRWRYWIELGSPLT